MSEYDYKDVHRLFNRVIAAPERERQAVLNRECGGDEELKLQVLAMVAAGGDERCLGSPTADAPHIDDDEPTASNAASATRHEGPGQTIDRYRLLQQIGEGGFGVVYMAEQTEPVNRRVALKIIKLGMDTKQVIARFEAERQALAMMDHPSIAKVLDAGATDTGRPYFVMELVKGVPITEYCDKHNLDVKQRLLLFQQVCHAVQHAHQKGIIHRDIKPSNVMITLHDGKPVPKVIDFGIAKATNARLTEKTVLTEYRQFIGTPEYMSPEQAEMSGLDIDTRSDVYSLGVLLYELLTGVTPFDGKKLRSAGYGEIQRIIREETPQKPSTRLSSLETLDALAQHRHIEPRKLSVLLRGDLDWIVMKAMDKDRQRRYETANGFALDIQRHLHNEPVTASPPSAVYRLRKFARRNRRTLAAATAVFIALVAGVIGSSWFAINAAEARDVAQREQSIAQTERQVAEASLDFMINLFEIPDPSESRGNAITAREVLDRGVEQIRDRFADQPGIRGRLLHTMGLVYINIGLFREAIPLLESAVVARRQAADGDDEAVASSLMRLGEAHHYCRDLESAVRHYRESLEIRRALHSEDDADSAASLDLLARALNDLNRYEQARETAEEGFTIRQRVLRDGHPDLSESQQTLGFIAFREGRFEDAAVRFRRAFEIRRAAFGDDHAQIPELLHALGKINNLLGNRAQAISDLELCLRMSRNVFGPRHQNVAHTLFDLGMVLCDDGRLDDGEQLCYEALEIYREVYGEQSMPTGAVIQTIGTVLQERSDYDGAEAKYREALNIYRSLDPPNEYEIANTLKNLGVNLHRQQRYEEAEASLLESRSIWVRLLGEDHANAARLIENLIPLYEDWGKADEASAWRSRLLADDADGG